MYEYFYFEFFNFIYWTIFKKYSTIWKKISHGKKITCNQRRKISNMHAKYSKMSSICHLTIIVCCIFPLYAYLHTLLKPLECTIFEFVATWNIPCKITMVPSIVPALVPFEFIITSLTRMKGLKPYTTMSIRLVRTEIRLVILLKI